MFRYQDSQLELSIPFTQGLLVFVMLFGMGAAFALVVWAFNAWTAQPEWLKRLQLHPKRGLNSLAWFAIVLSPIWLALLLLTIFNLFGLFANPPEVTDTDGALAYRVHYLAIVGLMTALAGLVGTPLALIRVFTTERQTRTAEQGHITDQINKAVENLGATRTLKDANGNERHVPNLEVRIGGILALERISKSSHDDHVQIMEILCAYIRENARQQVAQEVELDDDGIPINKAYQAITLRDDLVTAFDVIDRRGETLRQIEEAEKFRLNFRYADFRGLNLSARDLNKADLRWAKMQGADLSRAKMQGADLRFAEMQGMDLMDAKMQGANLSGAQMQGAHLSWAKMQGAHLIEAKMQGANLSMAKMQGARPRWAEMQGADLSGAEMQGADLSVAKFDNLTTFTAATFQGVAVKEVDFTNCSIKPARLAQMFGDASVTWPGGKGPDSDDWPAHWPKEDLYWHPDESESEFHKAWRAWQDEIGFDRETFTIKHPPK
ncbi:pentapeptide repeat-containing protein [Actibacterium sp. XHP0104]|uniref:pentapeptide repeat-containing protein n=1 Tax=Actibacterium sp. XHP0104 TaxID=2984335 RepID=UPI0021E841E6|nr:pentapeptide repeat-containing protein [Actibacterium sp. XHP0104]MCV2880906.1 pentapeptide repeat-containing protein [Actibacterium sp. XHP0104]